MPAEKRHAGERQRTFDPHGPHFSRVLFLLGRLSSPLLLFCKLQAPGEGAADDIVRLLLLTRPPLRVVTLVGRLCLLLLGVVVLLLCCTLLL
jgi:hypothetical protein